MSSRGHWERLAEDVARRAHGETLNKHNGERYILHPQRVVEHLRKMGAPDLILAIAWLHDVVEDTDTTLDDLMDLGFPGRVILGVEAITHRVGESNRDYYSRVGMNVDALMVKLSDLRDNTDPARRAGLPEATQVRLDAKYALADRCLRPWVLHHQFARRSA